MKRILTAVALLSALTFSACKKTEVTQVIENTKTIVGSIAPSDWKPTDASKTRYIVSFNMPEIDADMNASGGVLVYISLGTDQNNNSLYDALPSTIDTDVYTTYHTQGSLYIDLTNFNGGAVTPPNFEIPYKIMLVRAGDVTE